MARALTGLLIAVGLSLLSAGCQNKVFDENQQLRAQNRELQAKLEQERNSAPPPMIQNTPPAQPLVAAQPPAVVETPAPRPAAPAKPDLGNLETTVDTKAGTTTVNLPGDLFFDPGQITIRDSAKKSLDKVASALKKEYAGKTARIVGYTDSDPIVHSRWSSNQELSEKRAQAVKDYLVSKGVTPSRLTIKGMGEAKPRSTTDKSLNRRVEVVVLTA